MIIIKQNRSGILCYWDDELNASKKKSRLEKHEQKDLNAFCNKLWPELSKFMFHVVNESGGKGSAQYGSELKQMGRKSGIPDWLVMVPMGGYHGLF